MRGDFHVRFCERLGVKFPLPTRLDGGVNLWAVLQKYVAGGVIYRDGGVENKGES